MQGLYPSELPAMDYQELGHYERTRPNKYGEDLLPLRGRFRNMSPDDGSSSDSGDGRLFRRRARSISPYYHSRNQEDSDDEGGAGRDHVVANSIHKNYSAGKPKWVPHCTRQVKHWDANEA